MDAASAAPADKMAPDEAIHKIWAMCQDIVGSPIEFVPDASLADLGIGELGMAELLYQIDHRRQPRSDEPGGDLLCRS